jgi:aspartate kinase
MDEDMAKVSIGRAGMRSPLRCRVQDVHAPCQRGINIELISTSEIKISCVIESKYGELACGRSTRIRP